MARILEGITDGEEPEDTGLQDIDQDEGRSVLLLEVEGDRLKSAHLEEGLELETAEPGVVDERAVEVGALLRDDLDPGVLLLVRVVLLLHRVLESLRVQLSVAQEVEVEVGAGPVVQVAVDADRLVGVVARSTAQNIGGEEC